MTEQHFKAILSRHYPDIKFFKSEDGTETWVYPWKTPEEPWGLEKVSFFNYPRNKYILLSKTDTDPLRDLLNAGFSDKHKQSRYRFPNNDMLFALWVAEQARLKHPFYCGGFPQLDALCRVR